MSSIVCFVSDFGSDDAWVGVCHAVMYEDCPEVRVVDLSHEVPPFDIRKGAVVAASGAWQLPSATHLVVVDPGVGGGRREVCLVTGQGTRLVGPDNGVLLPAAWRSGDIAKAFSIDASRFRDEPPFPTFHARDVLAPAAARLACGADPASLGEEIDPAGLVPAPFSRPRSEGGVVLAETLDVDRFGSLRIGVTADELEAFGVTSAGLELSFGHLMIEAPQARTYAEVDEGAPVVIVDSSGWLTLALRKGSAAERYGIEVGTHVRVRVAP